MSHVVCDTPADLAFCRVLVLLTVSTTMPGGPGLTLATRGAEGCLRGEMIYPPTEPRPRTEVESFMIAWEKTGTFGQVQATTDMSIGNHLLKAGGLEVSPRYVRRKGVAIFKSGRATARFDGASIVAGRLCPAIHQPPSTLPAAHEIILEPDGKSTLKTFTPVEHVRLPAAIAL